MLLHNYKTVKIVKWETRLHTITSLLSVKVTAWYAKCNQKAEKNISTTQDSPNSNDSLRKWFYSWGLIISID